MTDISPLPAENADFVANNDVIVIPASLRRSRVSASGFISMTLLDDLVVEGNETVELVIEDIDADRVLVRNQDPIILTIMDNDSKWRHFGRGCLCTRLGQTADGTLVRAN